MPSWKFDNKIGMEASTNDVSPSVAHLGWPRRSRELVFDHIANQVGYRLEAQLIEYATLISADGLAAQVQFGGDLARTPACRQRQQDPVFLGREIRVESAGFFVGNSLANQPVEMLLAAEDISDSLQQIGTAGAL